MGTKHLYPYPNSKIISLHGEEVAQIAHLFLFFGNQKVLLGNSNIDSIL